MADTSVSLFNTGLKGSRSGLRFHESCLSQLSALGFLRSATTLVAGLTLARACKLSFPGKLSTWPFGGCWRSMAGKIEGRKPWGEKLGIFDLLGRNPVLAGLERPRGAPARHRRENDTLAPCRPAKKAKRPFSRPKMPGAPGQRPNRAQTDHSQKPSKTHRPLLGAIAPRRGSPCCASSPLKRKGPGSFRFQAPQPAQTNKRKKLL